MKVNKDKDGVQVYINYTFYLGPIIAIIVGLLPLVFLKKINYFLIGVAALAYFTAIGSKIVMELLFEPFFTTSSIQVYVAYGLLTLVFEIGYAYVFLLFISKNNKLEMKDSVSYGAYLGFYENFILLGVLALLSLIVYALTPASALPQSMVSFYSGSYLPFALPHLVDRLSSMIAHMFWGFMVFISVIKRTPKYFLYSMPMAFVDSIAAWWDFTHVVSYPIISIVILSFTTAIACLMVYLSGASKFLNETKMETKMVRNKT